LLLTDKKLHYIINLQILKSIIKNKLSLVMFFNLLSKLQILKNER